MPQIPAADFSLASWPRAGPDVEGVLVFLMPALAEFQIEPKASPPEALAVGDLIEELPDGVADAGPGTGTEVK